MNNECALLLLTLLQYAHVPMSRNSPNWTSITVPLDFISEAEEAIGRELAAQCSITNPRSNK